MLEKIIKYIPITTTVILYLFICGGVYLVGFWSTFDISIIGLVEIMDIPKTFILPFSQIIGPFIILVLLFFLVVSDTPFKPEEEYFKKTSRLARKYFLFHINFWLIIGIIIIPVLFYFYSKNLLAWILIPIFVTLVIAIKLIDVFEKKGRKYKVSKAQFFTLALLFITPFLCFITGKINSLRIYGNSDIRYININKYSTPDNSLTDLQTQEFKLLGIIGNRLIISQLNNEEIIILSPPSIAEIILTSEPTN